MSEWNVSVEPSSEPQSGVSAFSNKEYINEWVDSLPAAATGESSRRIYLALQDLAQHRVAPAIRFHFLERSGVLFHGIMRNLERSVYRGGFPLNEISSKTARLLLSMLALRVVNYRLVLNDLHESLFAGGLKRQYIYNHSLLRVLEAIGEIFELYRHMGIHPAPGLWSAYNRFYAISEAENVLKQRLMAMDGNTQTSITSEFFLQHLLDALNPHDFRHSEYHCVKRTIQSLVDKLPLRETGSTSNPYSFCLRLDEDAAISFFEPEREVQHEDSPHRRCLDIQLLVVRLQHFIHEQKDTLDVNSCQLSRHAARMMLAGWKVHQDARSQRHEASQSVRLVHGLSNIALAILQEHMNISPELPVETEDVELSDDDEGEVVILANDNLFSTFEVDGVDFKQRNEKMFEDADLWNAAYINIVEPSPHWAESFRKDCDVVIMDGQLLNQSPSGYGIQVDSQLKENRFQIGDLIAINVDHVWHLLTIRWIRNHSDGLRMGLYKLGGNLRTQTLVVSRKGKPSQPMPVLQIEHYRGVPAVVLHNINIHPRDTITFVEGDAQVNIQVGELLDTSAVFECYQLDRANLQ